MKIKKRNKFSDQSIKNENLKRPKRKKWQSTLRCIRKRFFMNNEQIIFFHSLLVFFNLLMLFIKSSSLVSRMFFEILIKPS